MIEVKDKVKVSVILPCYNQGKYLAEALDSVMFQTYTDWEAIVVNDGSLDQTEEVALAYTEKDKRIRYYSQNNKGVSAARNLGIQHALGEFILPLDPDDMLAPTFIEKSLSVFRNHSDCLLVYSETQLFGAQQGHWNLPLYEDYKKFLLGNCIVCTSLFRKKEWERAGGYDEDMHIGLEDWEFYIRLLQSDKKVYHLSDLLFFYRIKAESRNIECNKQANYEKVMNYVYQKHLNLYLHYYGSPFELIRKLEYYSSKFEKYHNKWYRRLWYKIRFNKRVLS